MTSSSEFQGADTAVLRFPHGPAPEPCTPVEISDGILWIRLPLPMVLDHVNVYALRDRDGWTIIDTGINSSRTREIWSEIMAGPLGGRPIRRVVLTHHHPDHVGLAGWFKSEFGAEIWSTRVAWLMSRMLTLDVQAAQTPESIAFYRDAGVPKEIMAAMSRERPFNFADIVYDIPAGFRRIRDGDTVEIGGRKWDVRTGGGHAPEHATLWCRDSPLVIGGDQFLADISPNIGVYPTEPEADPLRDWLESCRRFRGLADNCALVLVGHKLPYTGLKERIRQLEENHISALGRLSEHLRQPSSAADCLNVLFKRDINKGEYGFAIVESVAHLNFLYQSGEAARLRRADGAWQFVVR